MIFKVLKEKTANQEYYNCPSNMKDSLSQTNESWESLLPLDLLNRNTKGSSVCWNERSLNSNTIAKKKKKSIKLVGRDKYIDKYRILWKDKVLKKI